MARYEQGLPDLQKATSLSGNSPLYLAQVGVAYAPAGRKTQAFRIIEQLQKLSREQYVSPYGLVQIYAALNDNQQTFKWLKPPAMMRRSPYRLEHLRHHRFSIVSFRQACTDQKQYPCVPP